MSFRVEFKVKALLSYFAIAGLTLSLGASLGCTKDPSQPNVELIQDMMEQPAVMSQEWDSENPTKPTALVPPEHTAPQGFTPYPYGNNVEAAARELKNPFAGSEDVEVLMVGQRNYETHCQVCHGQTMAGGDSTSVAQKMNLKPPSLLSDKVKNWEDGRLYHVITMGQGLMGPYASHIPQQYRWQVVQYIRHMQKK